MGSKRGRWSSSLIGKSDTVTRGTVDEPGIMTHTLKRCATCRVPQPRECFSRNRAQHDGLTGRCRVCDAAHRKDWKANNRERDALSKRQSRGRLKKRRQAETDLLAAYVTLLRETIKANHYTRSVPSGRSFYFEYRSAIVAFSEPANPHTARWLLGAGNGRVLELSRLWAPDGHTPTLLTEAIAYATRELRRHRPDVTALVSYADPEREHHGGVYKAASWAFLGRSPETRLYTAADGKPIARRALHAGERTFTPAEVAARGVTVTSVQAGKLRFARGLTARARRLIAKKADRLQQ